MNDQAIEQEIIAKGKTAPRVTPADIEANIWHEHYFTAAEGVGGACDGYKLLKDGNESLGLLTFCVLVLRNGFTVTGESACASRENFDAEIGRSIARQSAVQKIWPLMGYELKQRLCMAEAYRAGAQAAAEAFGMPNGLQPHQQRVVDERAELDARLQKLMTFTCTPTFAALPGPERDRLAKQADTMAKYSEILGERIAAFAPSAD